MEFSIDPVRLKDFAQVVKGVAQETPNLDGQVIGDELAGCGNALVSSAGQEFGDNFDRSVEWFGDLVYGLGVLLEQSGDKYLETEEILARATAEGQGR